MSIRPRRSALFLPASNARAIEKARGLDADVVILDLEDAVAPEAKREARAQAVAAAREGFGGRELVVRINALDSDWGADDAAALRAVAVDAVLIPKLSSVAQLAAARAALGDVPLWAMIETCAAMLGLPGIAAAASKHSLTCLVAGTNDLAKDMRATLDPARTAMLPQLVAIVTAARAHGLAAIDGVYNAIDDHDRLAAECAQGAMLGFDGKSLIHPAQLTAANQTFAPSEEAIAQAEAVIAAFADPANAGKGAIRVEGRMVERLHLAEAERVTALARAIKARSARSG